MKKQFSRKKVASVVLPTTATIALAISLPLTLSNLLNNERGDNSNSAKVEQLSNANLKANNNTSKLANDGKTDLLPSGSQIITTPTWFESVQKPSNWSGEPQKQTLLSSQYASPSVINLNVYNDTTISAIVAIPKEYATNSNFAFSYYWTFLGNSKSLGALKGSDESNPDSRGTQGVVLPSSWVTNTIYKTPTGEYRLKSVLNIPKQYAPYFYNQHQSGNWQNMGSNTVAQYFNLYVNTAKSSTATYATGSAGVNSYIAQDQYVIRVEVNGISSKQSIDFQTNLSSTTQFIQGKAITLKVVPYNVTKDGVSKDGQGLYTYKYQWYLNNKLIQDTSNANIQTSNSFSGATTNQLTISNPGDDLDGANIYCKVIGPELNLGYDGSDTSKQGLQLINSASQPSFTNSNVTSLSQLKDFKIQSVNISSSNADNSNGTVTSGEILSQGQSLTLSSNVSINPIYDQYLTYQWYLNGEKIKGATNSKYTISNANSSSSGSYTCQVSLVWNKETIQTITSNARKISVVPASNFSIQLGFSGEYGGQVQSPTSQDYSISTQQGMPFNMYAVAYLGSQSQWSNSKVSYQWYRDGIQITNNNSFNGSQTNTLGNVFPQANSSGAYYCVATYKYSNGQTITATSNTIYLNVSQQGYISVSKNLKNITVENGQSATLEVNASYLTQYGQSPTLNYLWQYKAPNSSTWQTFNGPKKNPNKIVLTPQQTLEANGYTFQCQITYNPGFDTVSYLTNTATISVVTPNVKILSNPISISNAPIGSKQTLSVDAVIDQGNGNYTTNGLAYQWYTVDKNNKMTKIDGATSESYIVNVNDTSIDGQQYGCYVYPKNVINPDTAGKYTTIATISVLTPKVIASSLTVYGQTNLMIGSSTELSVKPQLNYDKLPSGYSLKYQWYKSDTANDTYVEVANGNSQSLSISNVDKNDDGVMYWCEVSVVDSSGTVVSSTSSRPAILNINSIDSINIQLPSSVKTYVNGSVTINPKISIGGEDASTQPNIKYQWKVAKVTDVNKKTISWTNIDQATNQSLTLSNVQASDNGNMYALQITIGNTSYISSFPTTLEVYNSSYVVNVDSTNVIVNEKQTATIKASVTQIFATNSNDYQYQWFVIPKGQKPTEDKNGNYTNGQQITGATKDTLTLSDALSTWDGAQFYCQVTLGSQVQTSQLATLDVQDSTISANSLPYRTVVENGSANIKVENVKTSFDIEGASLSYQWQVCKDGEQWENIVGQTTNALNLSGLKTSDNGNGYRVVITYADANTTYDTYISNPTTLIVNSNVHVNIDLDSTINAQVGHNLVIQPKVDITGTNLGNTTTYQWQKYVVNGANGQWTNVGSSQNTPNLSIDNVTSDLNNQQYRLIVNVDGDSFTSNTVTLKVFNNSFKVTTSTSNISSNIGGSITASVNVEQLVGQTSTSNYQYQWYAKQNDSSDGVVIKGQTTQKLSLSNVGANWNNAEFYCVVKNGEEIITSNSIKLNVNKIDILNVSLPVQVLSNNGSATFQINGAVPSYTINGVELTYQWQKADSSNSNSWTDILGKNTNTLTLSDLTSKNNGELYRCVVKYGDYATVYSNASILTVNSSLNVDIQLASQFNASIGQNVVIDPKIQISGNNLGNYTTTYQWQSTKTPNIDSSWTDVQNGNTKQLTINNVQTSQSNIYYRLIVTINGNTFTSNSVKLQVFNSPFVVNVTSDKVNVNIGANVQLGVQVSQLIEKTNSTTNYTYKWYVVPSEKQNDNKDYYELPSSYNTASIRLENAQLSWNGAKFYCVVTQGETQIASQAIELEINQNSISYDQLPPVTIVNNSKATITLENVKPDYVIANTNLTYKWQVNRGNGWVDLDSSENQTNVLTLNDLTYIQNGNSYRCVISYGNTSITTNATTLIIDASVDVNIQVPIEINSYNGGSIEIKPDVTITGNNINPASAQYQWKYAPVSPDGVYHWQDVPGGNQKDLTLSNLKTAQDGYKYKLFVTIAGQTYSSSLINLNVYNSPFVVNTNSTNERVEIGGTANFSVYISKNYETNQNDNYKYEWFATQSTTDLSNAIAISNSNASSLEFEGVEQSWDGWYFYCVVTQNDIKQQSPFIKVQVIPNSIQVGSLDNVTKVQNSNAVLEIKTATPNYEINGATIKYQWQVNKNGQWVDLVGQTGSVLSLTGLDSTNNGWQYRCKVTYVNGDNVYATNYSNATTIIVNSTVDVSITIPEFINSYENATVSITPTINIQGTNLGSSKPTYQWQKYNASNKTWEDVSGANSEKLTLSNVQSSNTNDQYRLVVNLNGSKFISDSTTLRVFNSSFAVNASSQEVSTNIGQQFEISVNVNQIVGNDDTFTYQWYVLANGSSDAIEISGATESSLVLKNPEQPWNNAKFYCVVKSNSNGSSQQSQNIVLTINQCKLDVPNLPTISVVKNNQITVGLGEVTPSYSIPNAQITYQWQKYNVSSKQWENVNQQTNNTLTLKDLSYLNNGDMYRCEVRYGSYAIAYSTVTTLVVNTIWNVDINVPNEVNTSINQDVTLQPSINITGENVDNQSLKSAKYQWQIYNDKTWENIEGATESTYVVQQPSKDMNGKMYRLVVVVDGNTFTSNSIILNVYDSSFVVNTSKGFISTNIEENQTLSVSISNTYQNTTDRKYSYQWYYVPKGSTKANAVEISGATQSTYTLEDPQLNWSGTKFYCVVTSGTETQASPLITLSVNEDPITSIDLNPTVTSTNGTATIKTNRLNVAYPISNATFAYQWFQNIKGEWVEMEGQNGEELQLTGLTASDNGNAYRCLITYTNGHGKIYSSYLTNDVTLVVNANATVQINVPSKVSAVKNGPLEIQPTVDIETNSSNADIKYQWQMIDPTSLSSDSPQWQNVEGQTEKNLDIKNIDEKYDGYSYRLQITVGGSVFTSGNIKLQIVNTPFVVNTNSTSYSANAGSSIQIGVHASSAIDNSNLYSPDFKYQWYYVDLGDPRVPDNPQDEDLYKVGTLIDGATSSTLTLNNLYYDYDFYRFFCVVTGPGEENQQEIQVASPIIAIYVNQLKMRIANMPSIVFAKDSEVQLSVKGITTSYKVEGAQFTYQWYMIENGKKTYLNGQTNSTLILKNLTSAQSGYEYGCEVSYQKGMDIYDTIDTTTSTIIVNTTMNVDVSMPKNINGVVGGQVVFKPDITITGENLGYQVPTYQWEYATNDEYNQATNNDDISWKVIDDYVGRQPELDLSKITKEMNGYAFRLKITILGNTFISTPCVLTVNDSSFVVNVSSNSISAGIGQSTSVTVNISQNIMTDTNAEYTYQWYSISNPSQIGADGKLNGNLIPGATNPVLNIKDVKENWNDLQFYCVVKLGDQTAISSLVTLNVKPVSLTANELPVYVTANDGKATISVSNVTLNYQISNTQITYQWQKMNENMEWVNVPLQTNATLNLNNLTIDNNGDVYRCVISYGDYATFTTSPTSLIVNSSMSVSVTLPNQINGLLNGNAYITPNISINGENIDTNNITYQWKVAKPSSNYSLNYEDVQNDTANKQQLVLDNLTQNENGNFYQLVVTIGNNTFTSNPVQLHVLDASFVVNVQSGEVSANLGQELKLSASVDNLINGTNPDYKYQWYVVTNSSSYSMFRSSSSLEGIAIPNATEPTLDIKGVDMQMNGVKFYCQVSLGDEVQYSAPIEINVNNCDISFANTPIAVYVVDGKATLQVNDVNVSYQINDAKLSYQWQVSTNNGETWTNIEGATDNILQLSDLTYLNNGYTYRCVISYGSYSTANTQPTVLIVQPQNTGPINPGDNNKPDDNTNSTSSNGPSAWIAIPIVFGSIAAIGGGLAIWWFLKKRSSRWM